MTAKKAKRLSCSERVIIETLVKEKRTPTYIAKQLKRSVSTITRELNKWRDSSFYYKADFINEYVRLTRKYNSKGTKLEKNSKLRMQVYKGLLNDLSPEAISGRLKAIYSGDESMQISYESIYRHIYLHPQGRINKKLIKLLCRHKSRRRKKVKQDRHKTKLNAGISIEQRPKSVATRLEAGHWEGDLVMGVRQKSCIGTIVERKSRYTLLVKLNGRKSNEVCSSFTDVLVQLPELFRKTMTYDNGSEMAEHNSITQNTGMKVFFAHPYSSWERGTNENTNGLIRRFYPKKTTDFNKISFEELQSLQKKLNNRPRKVLGYHTPKEMYEYELIKNNKNFKNNNHNKVLEMGNKSQKDLFSFLMPNQQLKYGNYT